MKNFFYLLLFLSIFSARAQNNIAWYNFSDGSANDISGNAYNGILSENAKITCDGVCGARVGYGTASYLNLPVEVLNGLHDFTLEIEFSISAFSSSGYLPVNSILSASNNDCINCFGIGYDKSVTGWKIFMNEQTYTFNDSMVAVGSEIISIKITRKNDLVSFFHGETLLGAFKDDKALNISSMVLGQQQHCLEGCYECGQGMRGTIHSLKVYDYGRYEAGENNEDINDVLVFPNPTSTVLHISSTHRNFQMLTITDYAGKSVYASSYKEEVDISPLSEGVYFLHLGTKENPRQEMIKFVISR